MITSPSRPAMEIRRRGRLLQRWQINVSGYIYWAAGDEWCSIRSVSVNSCKKKTRGNWWVLLEESLVLFMTESLSCYITCSLSARYKRNWWVLLEVFEIIYDIEPLSCNVTCSLSASTARQSSQQEPGKLRMLTARNSSNTVKALNEICH